jgi:hypothetical protein
VENRTNLLEELFSSLMDVTDTLGMPILRENAFEILETEIKHIQCLQDPTEVLLLGGGERGFRTGAIPDSHLIEMLEIN